MVFFNFRWNGNAKIAFSEHNSRAVFPFGMCVCVYRGTDVTFHLTLVFFSHFSILCGSFSIEGTIGAGPQKETISGAIDVSAAV